MDRGELLQRRRAPKSLHRTLSSAERQVRVFHPIVLPPPHLAAVQIAEIAHRRRVGSQTVSDHGFDPAVTLQCLLQKHKSRSFVPFFGDVGFQDFALVIHGSPQVMPLAVDVGYATLRDTNTSSRCHRQCRKPRIREQRRRRISAANIGPNRFHQNRTVSWQMSMPRSNSKSSTFLSDSGNRTYIMTTSRITSGEELK